MKFVIRPAARNDILRQYRYYLEEKSAPAAAEKFLEAVDRSIRQICLHPQAGSPKQLENALLQGLRSHPVQGFPKMRVYYVAQPDLLRVVRVLHGKRDLDTLLVQTAP